MTILKRHIILILVFLSLIIYLTIFSVSAQEQQKLKLIVTTGISGSVELLSFSPDGKILMGSSGSTVKLWEISSGKEIKTLRLFNSIKQAEFSSDGKTFFTRVDGVGWQVWDIETGNEIEGNLEYLSRGKEFSSPDGSYRASVNTNYEIVLTNVATKETKILPGHSRVIRSLVFSPDSKTLVSLDYDGFIKKWSVSDGKQLLEIKEEPYFVNSIAFSPDGNVIANTSRNDIKFRNIITGEVLKIIKQNSRVWSIAFSPDGKTLAIGGVSAIKLWDIGKDKELKTLTSISPLIKSFSFSQKSNIAVTGHNEKLVIWNGAKGEVRMISHFSEKLISSVAISPNGGKIVSAHGGELNIFDQETGGILHSIKTNLKYINLLKISSDNRTIAGTATELENYTGNNYPEDKQKADKSIKLWDIETGNELQSLSGHAGFTSSISFSPDGKILITAGEDKRAVFKVWNILNGQEIKSIPGWGNKDYNPTAFSLDGKMLAITSNLKIKLYNTNNFSELRTFEGVGEIYSIAFSPDNKKMASTSMYGHIQTWDVESGKKILQWGADFASNNAFLADVEFSSNGKFLIGTSDKKSIEIWESLTGREIASLIFLDRDAWVISTPSGRFDTNKSLDNIEGLHWIINDEILNPLPLDIFMRQYYEPNLLQKVLKCNEENNCDKEFKTLPSITEINRVQPKVLIKDVRQVKDSADLVDVTVEIENVTEELSVSAADRAKKEKKTSGVFDLRLFRDEQLVGISAPPEKLEKFIRNAPRLVEESRNSGKLIDTPEDRAWREANDVFAVTAENVRKISPEKLEYTFRNVRLPKDGRESVEFKAYAFNADKVKSQTTEPFKFQVPKTVSAEKKKGKAIVVSIGVNASENPAYDLRYAANDAREMQKIVGGNLLREKGAKYSDVIRIPLVSDHKTEQFPAVNAAQKEIIRGVFALLAGKNYKDVLAGLEKINPKHAEEFQKIPDIEKLSPIEPEDTLIITFAGHGYADNSGIFYLLPFDIGKDTKQLKAENLNKMISSDELSLWMQEITASEMIFIIDACHSSAAVQGDGFKPGPMASRGLGQLAYDKDMKILSATQADNVALELGSLQQGLLSYALLQDGIINALADADQDKNLFSNEWLGYAEKRVPELYAEVREGKRGVFINGEQVKDGSKRSEVVNLDGTQKSNLNLQQPTVFDFKRRKNPAVLMKLP